MKSDSFLPFTPFASLKSAWSKCDPNSHVLWCSDFTRIFSQRSSDCLLRSPCACFVCLYSPIHSALQLCTSFHHLVSSPGGKRSCDQLQPLARRRMISRQSRDLLKYLILPTCRLFSARKKSHHHYISRERAIITPTPGWWMIKLTVMALPNYILLTEINWIGQCAQLFSFFWNVKILFVCHS